MNAAESLQERIDRVSSADELPSIFGELQGAQHADPPLEALDDLRLYAFHAARRMTLEAHEHARAFILDDLLPLCLMADAEWPRRPRVNRYPGLLKEWLHELPWRERTEIRDEAVRAAASELGGARGGPACARSQRSDCVPRS